MNKFLIKIIFPIFNYLYKINPTIYIPLYFIYKYLFEAEKIKYFRTNIKNGNNIVIVGANIGFYTKLLSRLVGSSGKVYSFEPDPGNFKILKRMCGKIKNVVLIKKAVSNKSGKLKLYLSESLNTDHQSFDIGEKRKAIKVPCIKLDDYFDNKIKIDLIKIDIQGYDYYAFMGMEKLLKRTRGITLLGELWPYALSKSGILPEVYVKSIKKFGFKFTNQKYISESQIKKIKDPDYYVDFIATKS